MNSGLYKEPCFSTLSWRLANQIIIPQPAAGPSRSAVRFSVQILAWEDCEWLSLLLGLSCSRLISCSYPVIFGWLFISILGYNPHHKPRTWQLCEISAWNKHAVYFKFQLSHKIPLNLLQRLIQLRLPLCVSLTCSFYLSDANVSLLHSR